MGPCGQWPRGPFGRWALTGRVGRCGARLGVRPDRRGEEGPGTGEQARGDGRRSNGVGGALGGASHRPATAAGRGERRESARESGTGCAWSAHGNDEAAAGRASSQQLLTASDDLGQEREDAGELGRGHGGGSGDREERGGAVSFCTGRGRGEAEAGGLTDVAGVRGGEAR